MTKSKIVIPTTFSIIYILITKLILTNYFKFFGILLLVMLVTIFTVWMFIVWLKDKSESRWYWFILLFSGITSISICFKTEEISFEPFRFMIPLFNVGYVKKNYYLIITFPIGAFLYYLFGPRENRKF